MTPLQQCTLMVMETVSGFIQAAEPVTFGRAVRPIAPGHPEKSPVIARLPRVLTPQGDGITSQPLFVVDGDCGL